MNSLAPTTLHARVVAAATRLMDAASSRRPCAPVRALIGADSTAAYAVQQAVIAARTGNGAAVSGRKIGLTARAVQEQLGVDQPDFGVLLDEMAVPDAGLADTARLLQPRIEAEVAFILGEDIDDTAANAASVRAAVAYAVPALEIVDSRIAGWDITYADTVADNASSGLYVLGPDRRSLTEVEPRDVAMTMSINGAVASTGTGADCLGDPLAALAWLARTAAELGDPLRAGQVILSGALGPMAGVQAGDTVVAQLTGFAPVSVQFTTEAVA